MSIFFADVLLILGDGFLAVYICLLGDGAGNYLLDRFLS